MADAHSPPAALIPSRKSRVTEKNASLGSIDELDGSLDASMLLGNETNEDPTIADAQTPAADPIPPTESSSAEASEGNQAPDQPQPQPQPQPPLQLQPQSDDEDDPFEPDAPQENQTNEVLDVEVDGIYNDNNRNSGYGFIARNAEGVRLAYCRSIDAQSMEHAEIIAVLEAIRTLDWEGYPSLRLFTTCRLIVPGLEADDFRFRCPEGHEELITLHRMRIYCPEIEFNYRNREDMRLATRLAELVLNYDYEEHMWDARTATVSFEEWLRQIGVDGQGGQG